MRGPSEERNGANENEHGVKGRETSTDGRQVQCLLSPDRDRDKDELWKGPTVKQKEKRASADWCGSRSLAIVCDHGSAA